jgi:hypothetical protein
MQFSEHKIETPFRMSDGTIETLHHSVWVKDSMAYLEEVLADPSLQDSFELYAYKEFLHLPGKEPERIITGYMSANDAFEAEVCHAICTRTLLTSHYRLTCPRGHDMSSCL